MPSYNTDYLKFDAHSVRDTIIQKLSENPHFTDQVFQDSNLRILIDNFSYLFELLTYYINHSASESMFTDVQLYENINRIVKMLGYNPNGYISSKTDVIFAWKVGTGFSEPSKILPKYTYINTNLTDTNGKPIYFSTIDNTFIRNDLNSSNTDKITVVNGRWKAYDRTFIAGGLPFETFTLDQLVLDDINNPRYVAHPYIDVYVKRTNNDGLVSYILYQPVSDGTLFGTGISTIGPDQDVYELRLNENKKYTLKFGDGIHGSKLLENDEIYVVYLESNGSAGKIGAGVIGQSSSINTGIAGLTTELFLAFIGITDTNDIIGGTNSAELTNLYASNITASTTPSDIETVESIRENAPNWFRMGGRLVTAQDFEQYIKTTYKEDIYDVKVMNNWEYMSKFHQWLYNYNKLTIEVRKLGYTYADSCDFNNVYIWSKFKYDINSDFISRDLIPRKVLTCEPIIINALETYFIPCVVNNYYSIDNFDPNIENWIEILKDKNSYISPEKIKKQALDIIREFFNPERIKFGEIINLSELYNRLNAIDGVKEVYTVYKNSIDANYKAQYFKGLSFGVWTKKLVNGADFNTYMGNVQLQDFQFATLLDSDLESRVKVVFETFGQVSVEY